MGRTISWVLTVGIHSIALLAILTSPRDARRDAETLTWVDMTPPSELKNRIVDTRRGERAEASPDAAWGKHTQSWDKQTQARHAGQSRTAATLPGAGEGGSELERLSARDLGLGAAHGLGLAGDYEQLLKEIPVGSENRINTKEFRHYAFYERVKEQLKKHWSPEVQERALRSAENGRPVVGTKPLVTRVAVFLDTEGAVARIRILKRSGSTQIDEVAVLAFERVGKFPNPPEGMFQDDGLARIHWEFILHPSEARFQIADNTPQDKTRTID